jgi:hypothetical protein
LQILYFGVNILQKATSSLTLMTQLREIGSVYPGFTIMIAKGLQEPYAKPESGANLVPYDDY